MQRLLSLLATILFTAGVLAACGTEGAVSGNSAAQAAPTETPFPTAPAVARPTYVVQRGTVQDTLEFTGRWRPRDQLPLAFEIAGSVRGVYVRTGDTVAEGQLLADYDTTDLQRQLDSELLNLETAQRNLESGSSGSVDAVVDAEIRLANARLNLESTRAGNPWTSVASARESLETARRNLERAERDYDDARSRPQDPGAAQAIEQAYRNLEDARQRVREAEISYQQAAQSYNNYQYQIANAENSVIEAELALERARAGGEADPSRVQAVRQAQLNIDRITAEIAQASLVSPIGGVVLEVNIQAGDDVRAFDTVIVVGLPEPREVIAELAYGDASQLNIGDVGVCEVFNRPETAVQCAVRRIPLSAREADQTTRVAAILSPDLPDGAQILVRMPLETREAVLWLPPVAIRTFQNRNFVVVQTPDGERGVDVVLGLQTDDRVEIVSGVNEGDVVIGGP